MTNKITYLGTSDLVWQPDIRVSSFPSGLLLVERSAVARKDLNTSQYPKAGDPMPVAKRVIPPSGGLRVPVPDQITGAIDGLYIWPTPRASVGPTHVTFECSAYGRANTTGKKAISEYVIERGNVLAQRYTFDFVIRSTEELDPFEYRRKIGRDWFQMLRGRSGGSYTITGSASLALDDVQRTNYGVFDELSLSFSPRIIPA
jgi:hypothetical protein